MTYYDVLGVPPNASRSEILLAYNKKVAMLQARNPNTPQQLAMVQKAFEVLSRKARRTQYDLHSLQTSSALTRNGSDPLEELVEAYKSQWKHLFQYPGWLVTEKIGVELLARVLFTVAGGVFGFTAVLYSYSDHRGNVSPGDISSIPGELRTAAVFFAAAFFFSREIYLVIRWLKRKYRWLMPGSAA